MPHRTIDDVIQSQSLLTANPTAAVSSVIERMNQANVGSILIVDEVDSLMGIFTERDALTRVLGQNLDPKTTPVSEVMSAETITLESSQPLMYAFFLMQENGFRHIPILRQGKPVGVISLRDMMSVDLAQLEDVLNRKNALSEVIGFGG